MHPVMIVTTMLHGMATPPNSCRILWWKLPGSPNKYGISFPIVSYFTDYDFLFPMSLIYSRLKNKGFEHQLFSPTPRTVFRQFSNMHWQVACHSPRMLVNFQLIHLSVQFIYWTAWLFAYVIKINQAPTIRDELYTQNTLFTISIGGETKLLPKFLPTL